MSDPRHQQFDERLPRYEEFAGPGDGEMQEQRIEIRKRLTFRITLLLFLKFHWRAVSRAHLIAHPGSTARSFSTISRCIYLAALVKRRGGG